MSELDLDAIRARADAATAGPWKLWGMSVLADPVGDSNLDTAILVANTVFRDANGRPRTNDADFIAAARTDVPALLAEVESLRASNGQIRGDLIALRAENAGLREREARRHSKFSQVQPRVSVLEILGCADAGGVGGPDHPSNPADCPVCRHALGLPEPVDGAGEAGQRLPSDATAALTQVHPDEQAGPKASAFLECIPTEWIRCPQCGWPGTVEGRCAQCGLDYLDDAIEDQS